MKPLSEPVNPIIQWCADSYMTLSNTCEAAVWAHLRHSRLHREQETIHSIFYDTCLILSFNTWGQHWVATESSDPVPLLHGPQRGALLLCQQCSALHLAPHTVRLTEIHNKMSRGSFPTGSNYRGVSWWFRAFVCVFFIIPRITGIQGEMNEWLGEMASSIPSVAWKRPKLSH